MFRPKPAGASLSATEQPWLRMSSHSLRASEPLWQEWVLLGGLLIFAAWLMGIRGVWALLLRSDPTGITLVIILVFTGATLWCGRRARVLLRERRLAHAAVARRGSASARTGLAATKVESDADPTDPTDHADETGWVAAYWRDLAADPRDVGAPLDLLLERTHGPHSTAWWVNGIQLKLGLLGKVIGFSILALEIGQLQNFDAAQSQDLLKSLTNGLGVALLTTMVGLVGNIILGLQLTRLDRYADELVAVAQRGGLAITAGDASRAPPPATPRAA
jgi:hypothetical protein